MTAKPIIGISADYQDRFIRERTDRVPLEHTPRLESWGKSIAGGVVFFFVVIPGLLFLAHIAADWLQHCDRVCP